MHWIQFHRFFPHTKIWLILTCMSPLGPSNNPGSADRSRKSIAFPIKGMEEVISTSRSQQ